MSAILQHASLGATLFGCQFGDVWQFRGLQYGAITRRFADPEFPVPVSGDTDCTSFGPRCPQNHIDFRHLLRIPLDEDMPEQTENEFLCLNLDVTMPAPSVISASGRSLPVLVWIHGGSQAVSFGTSSSRLCDPTNLVATSITAACPLVVVNINYRLNMFAFGNGSGVKNLALKDQRRAIDYVVTHINGFGGDPSNITLAGESGGAVYCHAQMAMNAPIRQCVLQSGSLYLSPPQSNDTADGLVRKMEGAVASLGDWTLFDAPVQIVLRAQADLGLVSFYIQAEELLEEWEENNGSVERLLIGDTEYEAVLWRNGVEAAPVSEICNAFDLVGEASTELRKLYGIVADRPVACKLGALDFLNDVRFTSPVEKIMKNWNHTQRPAFRFLFDQPNPWQSSSRAHHAVDLLYLFGSYDLSFEPSTQQLSLEVQKKWLQFVTGEDPWQPGTYWAFGPYGDSRHIGMSELAVRRRKRHLDFLDTVGSEKVDAVYKALATGRLSLLN